MAYSNNGKGSTVTATIALLEKPSQPIDEFDSPAFEGSDQSLPY
jgi:folylpolyglutamate synthase/dihydropteroate synthase